MTDQTHNTNSAAPTGAAPRTTLSRRTRIVAATGGTALAVGMGLGGLAAAQAQDTTSTGSSGGSSSVEGGVPMSGSDQGGDASGGHRNGGHHRGDRGGQNSEALAEALGVDSAAVEQAIREIREERTSSETATDAPAEPPSEEERQSHEAELASALANKLGVDSSRVTDALAQLEAERRDQHTAELTERLDEAVSAGTITEADKESILKAASAGVFGGGHRSR